MLRLFPAAALVILLVPVAAGLIGVALPAFGYLPALGRAEFSLEPFHDLLGMPGLGRSVVLSLAVGLATTACALGIVVLFVAGWRGTKLFASLERMVSPLLSVPHAAAAFGLAFLIVPSGLLFRLGAPLAGWERPPDLLIVQDRLGLAMMAGLVVKEIPFLFLMTLAALPLAHAAEMERLAASLGYGRIVGFIHAVMPSLYRRIRLAVLAVVAFSTSVVDVALILGPTTPAPLSVRILDWQYDADLDMHFVAAAGAILQVGVTALALLIWLLGERIAATICRGMTRSGWRARRDLWLRRIGAAAMAVAAGTVVAGICLLALWSVAGAWRFPAILPESLTYEAWMRLAGTLGPAFANSLALGAVSSVAATLLAIGSLEYSARHGERFAARALRSLYVPLIVPQIAFLFGLEILFSLIGADGTFAAVALAHLVFVFPYALLSLSEPWRSWDPRYGHAIRALGRGPDAVFWRVKLPMLTRPVLTATALGCAISVSLYLPTLLIGGGRWPTVTTEALALASGGDPRLIGATALMQGLLPFLGFAVAAIVPAIVFRHRRLMLASA